MGSGGIAPAFAHVVMLLDNALFTLPMTSRWRLGQRSVDRNFLVVIGEVAKHQSTWMRLRACGRERIVARRW